MSGNKPMRVLAVTLLLFTCNLTSANACTGMRLIAKDGATVYGRSMEWGTAWDLDKKTLISIRSTTAACARLI